MKKNQIIDPKRSIIILAFCLLLTMVIVQPVFSEGVEGETLKLRIIETTDLHVNIVNYDYYKDASTDEFGFAKTASLISQARQEVKNSVLLDDGDLLQGNPLGDYIAKVKGLNKADVHPVYKAMNLIGYDAATLGNHEFNYGIDFLNKSLKGAAFPYVSANVFVDDKDSNSNNDAHFVKPYVIIEKTFTDENGNSKKIKVGIIGLTPPQITQWDKANLEGKIKAIDMVAAAKKYVPQMKAEGADIVIALAHTGISSSTAQGMDENTATYLSKVEGISALLLGHSHGMFPDGKSYAGIEGVDNVKGLINGVPAIMPSNWGSTLGLIDLTLKKVDGKYTVAQSHVELRNIYDKAAKASLADADPSILEAVKTEHNATIEYVRGEVGQTTSPIHSFFALVQDDPSVQLVTNAQTWYVKNALKGTKYASLPVLSAGAPFKCGSGSPTYYTDIPKGTLAIKNMSDLYIYPNTVHAVLLKGSEIKEWLEWSAGQFKQIDVKSTKEQLLIDSSFPTYNYDIIDGVTYQIDVTQPAKYNKSCEVINQDANRIKKLMYQGKPIDPKQEFVVATNNYRASSTKIANPDGKRIILSSPDENRQAIIDYIRTLKTVNPSADNNWSFAPVKEAVNAVFESSPAAKVYAENSSTIKYVDTLDSGYAKYSVNLDAAPKVSTEEPVVDPQKDTLYIVQANDVLWKIAAKYGIDYKTLSAYNQLENMHLIYPGQKLLVPKQ